MPDVSPNPSPSTSPPLAPGRSTTEAIAALLGVLAPIGTAIARGLVGWQLVAALGVAGVVLVAYIASRTVLKLKGLALGLLVLLLPGGVHALPNLTDMPGAGAPPLLAQASPAAAQAAIEGPAAPSPQQPAMAPAPVPQAPTVPQAAVDPTKPICPEKPATQPPPSTTLGKVEKWLYVAGAVIALASVTAEKLDAIFAGRPSVTP